MLGVGFGADDSWWFGVVLLALCGWRVSFGLGLGDTIAVYIGVWVGGFGDLWVLVFSCCFLGVLDLCGLV